MYPIEHNEFIAVGLTLLAKLPSNRSYISGECVNGWEEGKDFESFLLDVVLISSVLLVARRRMFCCLSAENSLLGVRKGHIQGVHQKLCVCMCIISDVGLLSEEEPLGSKHVDVI